MSTIKTCGCGRAFTFTAWRDLDGVGRMPDGDGGELDMRNCPAPCHSTLAVSVADLDEDARLAFELKREAKIARFLEAAEAATDLARRYTAEDRRDGLDAREDARITGAIRQATNYVRAAGRLQAMTFNCDDLVLAVTMTEELAPSCAA